MTLDGLVEFAMRSGASDVHLRGGSPPCLRVHGTLAPVPNAPALTRADLEQLSERLLPPLQRERLRSELSVDVAWADESGSRCRASVFRERGGVAIAIRLIPSRPPSLEDLGTPPAVAALARESRGLVLVTGATGSGKSTTLAALVSRINHDRAVHILTIEDPIEFVHEGAKALVTQREVGLDVPSFAAGLRGALRQDPDILLLGELRDIETIEIALTAAETGHLVLSTMHTLDAAESISRIVSLFPPHQQPQVRLQLARVLRATVAQRLLPRADGRGRVLAAEVLVSTPYARECIADRDKTPRLPDVIAAGASEYGMQTFDQSILELCRTGAVREADALEWVTNVDEFRMRLGGITSSTAATQHGRPDIMRFGQ